jgi:hypothetical protein
MNKGKDGRVLEVRVRAASLQPLAGNSMTDDCELGDPTS